MATSIRGRAYDASRYAATPKFTSVFDAVGPATEQSLEDKLSPIKQPAGPWSKVFGALDKGIPFASNLINSFRRTPRVQAPRTVGYINPARVNYDAQRFEADTQMRGANRAADRNLDENTAAAVKAGNLATSLRAKNQIAEQESNTNAMLGMRAAQINAGIDASNTAAYNRYQEQQTEAQIADQRNSAANIANAADKYMLQQGEQDKANLDLKKLGILSRIYKDSGVYNRLIDELSETNSDVTGTSYIRRAGGGKIGTNPTDPHNTVGADLDHGFVNPTKSSLDKVKMNEMLSDSLLRGGNPLEHDNGKMLFNMAETAYGRPRAQKLITDIMLFGQDSNNAGLSDEEKIRRFYSLGDNGSLRNEINIADPVQLYNTSPNVQVKSRLLAKRSLGGSLKKVY